MNTTFQRPLYHSTTGSERSSFRFLHFVKALCFEGMIYLSLLPIFPSSLMTGLSIITMSILYGVVFSSSLLSPHRPRLFRAYGAVRSPVFSSSTVLYYINPSFSILSSSFFRAGISGGVVEIGIVGFARRLSHNGAVRVRYLSLSC